MGQQALRAELAACCRRLHARGILAGTEGNCSLRLEDGSLLVTASGIDKATIGEHDVLHCDLQGQLLSSPMPGQRLSSEVAMHLTLYRARPDIGAVVHAHPVAATGCAAAGVGLPDDVLPELPVVVGGVALVPYGRPGTPALGAAMHPFLADHEVFLLANHGVTVVGRTLTDAVTRMESVEQSAQILLAATRLGGPRPLPPGEAEALRALGPRARRLLDRSPADVLTDGV